MMRTLLGTLVLIALIAAPNAPLAQASDTQTLGPSSHLPIPRFVSLKTGEARARRGPSLSHRVDWLYSRRGLPLRVVNEFEHWRRVEDSDGEGGWVHYSQLSGARTVLITTDMAAMRSRPQPQAHEVAHIERGVVGRIMECSLTWCRINIDGTRGWVMRDALWGLLPGEVLD